MAKGARYSSFKESSTRDSWTIRKITQRLTSNLLLDCCCGSCYTGQKTASRSESNDANEVNGKNLESIIKFQIPSIDSIKSKTDNQLTEEISLTKRDYGMSKDDEFLTASVNTEGVLLRNHKDDTSTDTSDSKSKSSFSGETLSSGMKRVIGSLPILPKKEKKSPLVNDEKKASQSDSELGYRTSIFNKCSKRYGQQKMSTINIPELIIS